MRSRKSQRGSTLVEMAFVGIPMIFLLISLFEISRGMWIYATLSYAARQSTRYVTLHGQNCQTTQSCGITQAQLGNFINNASAGLDPTQVTVTFISLSDYVTCKLNTLQNSTCIPAGSNGTGGFGFTGWWDFAAQFSCFFFGSCGNVNSMAQCASATYLPTCGGNSVGAPISIELTYPFNSAIAMFFPGSKPQQFGQAVLPALSQDVMQY
jgi:hypothetical protein